jgi:hypothetical protein
MVFGNLSTGESTKPAFTHLFNSLTEQLKVVINKKKELQHSQI